MQKNIELKDIQRIEMEMLNEIKSICKKLKINYYLAGGTLLGAVRHKGFIPWDDDTDIVLKREDYIKLENYFKEKNNNYKHYKLLSLDLQSDYYYPMMKLVDTNTYMKENGVKEIENFGIYLDIFPVDNAPNNKLLCKLFLKRLSLLDKMSYMAYSNELKTSKKILKVLKICWFKYSKFLGAKKIGIKINKLSMKYNNKKSKFIGYLSRGEWKELIPAEEFEYIEWYKFGKEKHSSFKNKDAYLIPLYGDYMKLPPKEKQVTHHDYIAYFK